jgi:phospho-N-acetylmuramoyl-pentapeptide-transferase
VTRMLFAGVLASLIVIALGPLFIRWARRHEFGQTVREDGPQAHVASKSGTPTMGGLLILLGMSVSYWVTALIGTMASGRANTDFGLMVWITTMMCAAIGLWDDWMKISNRRSLGISGRMKLILMGCITAFMGWASVSWLQLPLTVEVPFRNAINVDLGWLWFVLLFFVLAGTSNTVNLADGLDGLAATTVLISLSGITAIAVILWDRGDSAETVLNSIRVLEPLDRYAALDIAVFCSAMGGALVGFLWWNAFPAKVFMGDTGSLALGGALAALAVVLKIELLLVVIAGLFVVEGVSVILQSSVFKLSRRFTGTPYRLFLMAPIHHHFELKQWSETQIMIRFAIVATLFSATGFTIWFRMH